MQKLGVVALCAALGGCAASKQEVVARLGDQYVGQYVDALVVKFGPPASTNVLLISEVATSFDCLAVTATT